MWEIEQYAKLINKILHNGEKRQTRAGEAYSIFGESITIDVSNEFPLLRGRQMFYKPVLGELAAMLRGPKSIEDFKKYGCNYWDSWGDENGDINVDYGNSWIDFNGVNQLERLVEKLHSDPNDRRLIVSGWRPDRLDELSLPCCHMLYQWFVRDSKYLDMVWYQRSVDTMVGLPSDIILAAAWNIILAHQCGYIPGKITLFLGDTHIYANHAGPTLEYLRQLKQVQKVPRHGTEYALRGSATIQNFVPEMMEITGYDHQPPIKFELNVGEKK